MSSDNEHESDRIRPPTPPVDAKVASLAERLQKTTVVDDTASSSFVGSRGKQDEDDLENSDDDDALFAELEDDDFEIGGMRERRMEELKREMDRVKSQRESDHGRLSEITDEKQVIRVSANEDRCVIHFFHRDFRRCAVMDKHLELLAPKHFGTRFIRVFVENVPWLVEKLQIKVLPCVICFIHGVSKDRLIGFEEIGNDDSFTTTALELRLAQSGVINPPQSKTLRTPFGQTPPSRGIRSSKAAEDSDDNDDDY